MHSLEINRITSIENMNHPNDFYIFFEGGRLTFNAANGPLRFWYPDGSAQELIQLESNEDVFQLRERLFQQNRKPSDLKTIKIQIHNGMRTLSHVETINFTTFNTLRILVEELIEALQFNKFDIELTPSWTVTEDEQNALNKIANED